MAATRATAMRSSRMCDVSLVDRLSSVDDSLLLHVLSFLEMDVIVRTSVLSKRWRNLWKYAHNLDFGSTKFNVDKPFLANFVTQVLLRREKSKIVKLRFCSEEPKNRHLAESLVSYAVDCGVEELNLFLNFFEDPFVFPEGFVNCPSLRSLKLADYYELMRLPNYLAWNALKYLCLAGFCFPQENFDGTALSTCPNLETLKLKDINFRNVGMFTIHSLSLKTLEYIHVCNEYDDWFTGSKFVVTAPRLTTFSFNSCLPIVCSLDCPTLERVVFDLHPSLGFDDDEDIYLHCVKMLNQFHNAKSITISSKTLEVLSACSSLLDEHKSTFRNLECLKVKCKEHSQDVVLPAFVWNYLLNSSSTVRVCF